VKVKFNYEIVTPKRDDIDPDQYIDVNSIDELRDLLMEDCPNMEWSVWPENDDVSALWAEIKRRQGEQP